MQTKYYQLAFLAIILGTVAVSGCANFLGSNNGTDTTKTSTGGNFENEWIKFQYPSDLVVLDCSDSTKCRVEIYNSSNIVIENMVGEIFYYKSNKTDLTSFNKRKSISIGGKSGVKIEDGLQVCSYVFLDSGDTDVKTMIMNFDAKKYRDAYQKIADTLNIKKIPD